MGAENRGGKVMAAVDILIYVIPSGSVLVAGVLIMVTGRRKRQTGF